MAESGDNNAEVVANDNINKDESYSIVLIGATGATGKYLFAELVQDKRFAKITAIGRRPASIPDDFEGAAEINLEDEEQSGRVQQVTDFDMNGEISKETVGKYFEGRDVFFSCFGTTRTQTRSAAEFRRIDFGINYDMAKVAKECNVPFYSLVSSWGASSSSIVLYAKCKGELEEKTTELGFDKISIWRPGLLERGKDVKRFVEKVSGLFFRSIRVQTVAKALHADALNRLSAVDSEEIRGQKIYKNADIYKMCESVKKEPAKN